MADESGHSVGPERESAGLEGPRAKFRYACSRPSCGTETTGPGVCATCGAPILRLTRESSPAGRWTPPVTPAVAPAHPETTARLPGTRRRRSMAWLFYAVLAPILLFGSVIVIGQGQVGTGFLGLLLGGLTALYARYLYRGGSIVFVPLPGCLVVFIVVIFVAASALMTVAGGRFT